MTYQDPHAHALTTDDLRALIAAHPIVALHEVHPAVWEFKLDDGRTLEMWDEGSDYGIFWELAQDTQSA